MSTRIPSPRPAGRPSKYCPETVDTICNAIQDGMPFKYACSLGGISQDCFGRWRRELPEFGERVQLALAIGIRRRLSLVQKAADAGDVKAAQWWLEHVFPEHFARNRIEVEHSGTIEHLVINPAQLAAIAESRKRYELDRGEPEPQNGN